MAVLLLVMLNNISLLLADQDRHAGLMPVIFAVKHVIAIVREAYFLKHNNWRYYKTKPDIIVGKRSDWCKNDSGKKHHRIMNSSGGIWLLV